MNWISDVRDAIRGLDVSRSSLRKFAFLVGFVLLILTIWMIVKGFLPVLYSILGISSILLLLTGLISPKQLSLLYKIWMCIAIAIGWWISRIILIIFFYGIITPTGLIARIVGKQFMDVNMKQKKESYWVTKESSKAVNYEKMH